MILNPVLADSLLGKVAGFKKQNKCQTKKTQTKKPTAAALGFLHVGSYILVELDSHVSCSFSPRGIQDRIANLHYTADLSLR